MIKTKTLLLALSLCCLSAGATVASAQTRPRVVRAEDFPGADIGARINAADRALGSRPGEIHVSRGGELLTQAVVSSGHTLRVRSGVYRSRTPGPPFVLSDNSSLICDSWDAILYETTAEQAVAGIGLHPQTGKSVFSIVQDSAGNTVNGGLSRGINVQGCHFKGARGDFNSALQTVSLGNCHNCSATRNWFDGTRTIGLNIGGGSMNGHYGMNVQLNDNLFTGVTSQNLSVTNAVNVEVRRNRFIAPGIAGGPGTTVIDVEPNNNDRVDNVLIEGNFIDASNSPLAPGGAVVTNGIAVNALNPTRLFRGVRVINNTIIGSPVTAPFGRIAYAGILLRAAPGVVVSGNTVQRAPRAILLDYGTTGATVEGNKLISSGSGSTFTISVEDSSNNTITGNTLEAAPGDVIDWGARAKLIGESGKSANNRIERNTNAIRAP